MPFKSKAQRRKFAELLVQGKITPEAYEEWNRETGSKKLPERVKLKSHGASRTKRKAKLKSRSKAKSKSKSRSTSRRKSR